MGRKLILYEEPEIYYDFLYQNHKNWVGYGIPISFIDPRSKYRVEGLIYSPKKRDRHAKSMGKIKVYYNFESRYLQQPVEVSFSDIFPSRRRLTTLTKEGIVETKVSSTYNVQENKKPIDFLEIKKVYDYFKGVNWTIPELLSILERPLDQEAVLAGLPFIHKISKRICRITNEMKDTYNIETPEPIEVVKRETYSIEKLNKDYIGCKRCHLGEQREARKCDVVFGRGNIKNPKIFILGEAPGVQEEQTGITFNPNAPAGGVLYKVMQAAGIDQERDCYITNSILCRPEPEDETKQNGKPSDESISICSSRLKIELAISNPKVIILLGTYAYKAFFGKYIKGPISNSLGWCATDGDFKVYLLYHPSYVVRQISYEKDPEKRAQIKQDYLNHFLEIKKHAGFDN